MGRILLIFSIACMLGVGVSCGKKDPGKVIIAIVSNDSLNLATVNERQIPYAVSAQINPDSMSVNEADSLLVNVIHDWIDRKLILRQARANKYAFDSAAVTEEEKIAQYLNEAKKENLATKWDAGEFKKKFSNEYGIGLSANQAKILAQAQKLGNWVAELRKKGGYRILDRNLQPRRKKHIMAMDTIQTNAVKMVLASLMPEISGEGIEGLMAISGHANAADVDSALLKDLALLFDKKSPQIQRESKAHLYRSAKSLKKVIDAQVPRLEEEFRKALKRNPKIQGKIIVRIVVAENGTVPEASVIQAAFQDDSFFMKINALIREWKFPRISKHAGDLVINYPFEFKTTE